MVKNRLMSLLLVALALGLGVTSAMAQGEAGRGRGGRGGFGGFGGGFGGGQTGILGLIGNEAVVKDLALSDEVAAKLKKISEEVRAEQTKARGNREDFAGFRDLSEEERNKKMAELRTKGEESAKKIRETFLPQVKEALSAEQFERLHQIQRQASPLAVTLADAEVVKTLELTKEQQDKIASIGKEFGEKTRALFTPGAGGPGGGGREKMQELNKERDAAITAVLNADQTAKLATLKGKEFDVSKLRGMGPGGPGRRPGGAGAAGGRPATE